MPALSQTPPTQPPPPQSPADRWDGHACAYQDLMLELARIGTTIGLKLDALGGDLPILEQAASFCEVSRSVRLCALVAHKLSHPLPTKPAEKSEAPKAPPRTPPTAPEQRDADRRDTDRGDAETREAEASERLEDPMREHNLNRPLPELVKDIKRGLDAGALPDTNLQGVTEAATELAIRMAAHDPPPMLNRAARRAAQRKQAHQARAHRAHAHRTRAHPSG